MIPRSESGLTPRLFDVSEQTKSIRKADRNDGIVLCQRLNKFLNKAYFVALTGGLIFQQGERKDIDIIIYRNRATMPFETIQLGVKLTAFGFTNLRYYGFVTKCEWQGHSVDILHPESDSEFNYEGNP